MKKITSLIMLCLLTVSLIAQTTKPTAVWGETSKESTKTVLTDIFGFDGTHYFVTRTNFRKSPIVILQKYNTEMKKVTELNVPMTINKNDLEYEFVIYMNKKIYLFTSSIQMREKKNNLYLHVIDPKSLTQEGKPVQVAKIDIEDGSRRNDGEFAYKISADSSKLMIFYELPYQKGSPAKFGYKVFSNTMEELYSNNIRLPYNDDLFESSDILVDDIGRFYLLGKIYNDKPKDRKKGKPNYKYKILAYDQGAESAVEYDIFLENKFLAEMKMAISYDDNIICTGFFSEHTSIQLKGSYFIKLDPNSKSIISSHYKEFDIDFITQNTTHRQEKKIKKQDEKYDNVELYSYEMRDLVMKDDGGAIIIAEQYYMYTTQFTTYSANGVATTTSNTHYVYNDIIIINIAPDGSIIWNQKIAKRQHSVDDNGYLSSFLMVVANNQLNFIFNDNGKNLNYTGSGPVYNTTMGEKNGVVTLVSVDMNGNQSRQSLFSLKELENYVVPKLSVQISDNRVIIYGGGRRKGQFALLKF